MKTLQKYILSLLIIVSTVSMYAMDGREHQTSSLQAIVAKQGQAKLEQALSLQNVVATRAPLKKRAKLNLHSDILSDDLLKNVILQFLGGPHVKPSLVFSGDRGLVPWIIVKQRDAMVKSVQSGDYKGLRRACIILDFYRSLFNLSDIKNRNFVQSSFDFIKKHQSEACNYNEELPIFQREALSRNTGELSVDVKLYNALVSGTPKIIIFDDIFKQKLKVSGLLCSAILGCKKDKIDIVKFLLESGTSVHGIFGGEALLEAVKNKEPVIMKLLLESGADANYKNNFMKVGWHLDRDIFPGPEHTLLDKVYGRDRCYSVHDFNHELHVEMAKLLINYGIFINENRRTYGGKTLFHELVSNNSIEIIKLLLDRAVNINITDNDGKLPEDCTTNPEIKALIVQTRIDRAQKAALENQNKKDS